MKILILGNGMVGSVLAKLLSKEEKVKEVICGDIKVKKDEKNGKISLKKIDAKDKTALIEFLKSEKPDILVNALIPTFNQDLLECCLMTKTNYLDSASFWDLDRTLDPKNPNYKSPYRIEQLDYHELFKENKIMAMISSGVSPGLTNMLAKETSEDLDEIETIKIRIIEDTRSDDLYIPWCAEWLLDEIESEPLVYRDGKFTIVKRFSGEEDFDFSEPFGKKRIYLLCQDEVGTIPLNIKVKNVDLKAYDSQGNLAQFLAKMGLVSDKKLDFGSAQISPREFLLKLLEKQSVPNKWNVKNAQFGISVIAEGKKNGKEKFSRYNVAFPTDEEIDKLGLDANFISYPTALMMKHFVLAFPEVKKFGVFPPEALEKNVRKFILAELEKDKNITIKKVE